MSRDRSEDDRSVLGGISRRGLIGSAGVGVVAAGAGVLAGRVTAHAASAQPETVPFRGAHQAGITTAVQDRLHFAAFDVHTDSRAELVDLLRTWTLMAERMTTGGEAVADGAVGAGAYNPPTDTGEALDLSPSRLTLTIGFGPSLFTTADGRDRFGIAARRPAALADLPKFTGDALDPARGGGDIAIQACADDPQVAVHAVRNLARVGFGAVSVRWSQLGFGRTSSTSTSQVTPRNLLGFKDGTRNIKAEDHAAVEKFVWADPADGQAWMGGGSYLVTRRIRMLVEPWDRTSLHEQQRVIGRAKGSGAPLGGADEFDDLDLQSAGPSGPLVDRDAHVRLASREELGGIQILRRGYNFTDGSDGFGHLDAGLFFIAYCRDPRAQFVPMQDALARNDALNEYIKHVGSAVFACPPGLGADDYWGSGLFAE
ncbi:iron uptake transporter deferrochelatase/peroxidase subunit [Nocardia bovistercoris]|uniref:Deferrochelatase n=1 Tax=Nocardia bovistercoris TaxID=2785916 RepID=A0A931I899_9NOCA|nr:iron uptake transporter deferrochelatase/peroxidase subunit [Nocardia bovistercoris]MBH0776757.1 deferrochelatase/peroxidase EfeB [Nocardia bovistercoris]